MPLLKKQAVSQFIRRGCQRQLRFLLHPNTNDYRDEREELGLPDPNPPRPGLELVAEAGREWEAEKVGDLIDAFGRERVIAEEYITESGERRYRGIELEEVLSDVQTGQFVVEAGFPVTSVFVDAHGLDDIDLDFAGLRPDLILVEEAGSSTKIVAPDGRIIPLDADDDTRQLRIIDIKLTAEPNAAYFAEVTYYAMALGAWLQYNRLDGDFVVSADIALWPGSHDGSELRAVLDGAQEDRVIPATDDLHRALEEDLEKGPFSVFSSRLQKFFQEEVPKALESPWRELDWHVDHRCMGCEYLGQWVSNPDDEHCLPLASEISHLSRVPFVSRGARTTLQNQGVLTVEELADRDAGDEIFDEHQTLRATRTVVSGRATSILSGTTDIPAESGTSAVMPRWSDLRIYVSVDFDVGSAITFAFGLQAFWWNSEDGGEPGRRFWDPMTFIVRERSPRKEREQLLVFLERIREITEWAHEQNNETTVQVYLWDQVQYDHLTRIIGRHLMAILEDSGLRNLAWLFPPEEVVENPSQASRDSPITIVSDVVRAVLAAPIPHEYSLLNIARVYHHDELPEHIAEFSVHPHFEDPFSSQIPSERAHGIWGEVQDPRPWHEELQILVETVEKRLRALETVTRRLEGDLRDTLQSSAPRINLGPPTRENRVSWDGQLWMAFTKLNAALERLEVQATRAMPPHEREARFKSALLDCELTNDERTRALGDLGLTAYPALRVFTLNQGSREVDLREGEFLRCLAPGQDTSELDRNLRLLIQDEAIGDNLTVNQDDPRLWGFKLEDATRVTVEAIDRQEDLIVLRPNRGVWFWPQSLQEIEDAGVYDFSRNVSLEPMHGDYLVDKLRTTLRDIGNPEIQRDDPLVRRAVGMEFRRRGHRTGHTPVADILWDAANIMDDYVPRDLNAAQTAHTEAGLTLNPSQWRAWEDSLTHRIRLIWGPPGTGKTRTLRSVTLGAIYHALQNDNSLRVLIAAPTYNALDNVVEGVYVEAGGLVPDGDLRFYRARSISRDPPEGTLQEIDCVMSWSDNPGLDELYDRLARARGVTVVAATPHQVHKVIGAGDRNVGQEELFDLIIVDEASQMDVAESILVYAGIAEEGSLIVAGDPKQLAPIHKADPPLDLEEMVGSTYSFFRDVHGVEECSLTTNYRSNEEIVEFQRSAGYPLELSPRSPDLRISLQSALPEERPDDLPSGLPWGEFVHSMLEPNRSCVCVTYSGGTDSQWNPLESRIVTVLVRALKGRLGNHLLNDNEGPDGVPDAPYTDEEFWTKGLGVVTPHRAQQAYIIDQLQTHCGQADEAELIRDAVDTVERFQGQQRDVIIASYAVSDPDMIRDEDEFLQGLHRFNVLQSRARAKVIVFLSEELVQHLSEDLDVLEESRLLKAYATLFCNAQEHVIIPQPGDDEDIPLGVRYHR